MGVLGGWAFSYEGGTHVGVGEVHLGVGEQAVELVLGDHGRERLERNSSPPPLAFKPRPPLP